MLTINYRDLNHTPFHKHQDPTSFVNCQRILAQLIVYLLRTSSSPLYPIPLPPNTLELLSTLRKTLLDADTVLDVEDRAAELESSENIFQALHAVLLDLWMHPWNPSPYQVDGEKKENPVPDPTIRFLVCTQANRDGSLKDPQHVTGVIAKLVYCMVSRCCS